MDSKQQENLRHSYLETRYSVFIDNMSNKNQEDIYIGKLLPEKVNKLLEYHNNAVILTAWNPMSKLLTVDENNKRNVELKEKLLRLSSLVYPAIGQGVDLSWLAEESFFIVNMTQNLAQDVAVEFGQFAYVLLEFKKSAKLIFTPLWFK